MADSSKGDILKVRLGDDTRRLVLYNTHISYDDLVLMLQRIYNGQLKSSDDVTLKYYDDDGDLITIADATDFSHAREYSSTGVVKMVIFVNGSDKRQPINAQDIRKELATVRDKVNTLVDKLDAVALKNEQITYQVDNSANTTVPETISTTTNNMAYTAVVTEAISVFDPLKPSTDYSPIVTTTATTTQLPTTTTNFVPVSSTGNFVPITSAGNASHLFTGQSSSFLESSPGVQYIQQPTAPSPSSTPQPTQQPNNIYPSQPPSAAGQTANTHYTGSGNNTYPYTSQYQQQQPTASHHYPPPQPQGGQAPPQPSMASYAPYGAPPASMYQGNTYPPPGHPPAAGRGYTPAGPPPRNSPYRIGY